MVFFYSIFFVHVPDKLRCHAFNRMLLMSFNKSLQCTWVCVCSQFTCDIIPTFLAAKQGFPSHFHVVRVYRAILGGTSTAFKAKGFIQGVYIS
ncbi:hypothetical protein C002_02051 [Brucella abortus 600/64]|nr:hypothetical protein DK55_263 [Brucella abortus bv. 2 str. 86/8/59]EHR25183.1 hypothetical protein M1M_02759 [Brucella abortus bv. 1 str. NI259]ENR50365.1 hypothetical protein C002_02051 [Brucella abortus 600/64]